MHKLGFIFDMDGTMIDSMGYHAKSWALFCEAHGLTHPLPKVLQMTTGRTCVECMDLLFERPVDRQEALDYVHHKESLYRDLFESEFREVKGFKAFIAHITERGDVFFNYPPVQETIEVTLREAARCTREGIRINTFMLDPDQYLQRFVEQMTAMNGGRAFMTNSDNLGDYVLVDFLDNKRRTSRGGSRAS